MWCAPPARIQAVGAVCRSGWGSHSARATGSLGSGCVDRHRIDLVHDHAEAIAHIHDATRSSPGPAAGVEHKAHRVVLAADAQRMDLQRRLPAAIDSADLQHVRAEHLQSPPGSR